MPDDDLIPAAQAQAPTSDLTLKSDQARAREIEQEEEERRRAGRGGGDINPANASHSLNIRPHVGEGPAGLEVYTTMKSADYRANPGLETNAAEPARDGDEERRSQLSERTEHPQNDDKGRGEISSTPADDFDADLAALRARARDDDPELEQVYRRAADESTKRQDLERAVRSGEDVSGDMMSGGPDSFAADLRGIKEAARLEREADGHEAAVRGQNRVGPTQAKSSGPNIF